MAELIRGRRSSVGEAPAHHTGHCPPVSREIVQGRTGTPGTRVFLRWLGLTKPLRSAVLKLGREGTYARPPFAPFVKLYHRGHRSEPSVTAIHIEEKP